jgi:hypothetical protein
LTADLADLIESARHARDVRFRCGLSSFETRNKTINKRRQTTSNDDVVAWLQSITAYHEAEFERRDLQAVRKQVPRHRSSSSRSRNAIDVCHVVRV